MNRNRYHPGSAWLLGTVLVTTALAVELPAPPPPQVPDVAALPAQVAAEVAQATETARHARRMADQVIAMARTAPAAEELEVLVEAPEPPEPPDFGHFNAHVQTIVGDPFAGDGASRTPLLITTTANEEQRNQLTEDLKVMQRLLDKAAERAGAGPGADTAMGIVVLSSFGRPAPRTLYLDGFGAVFMLNVKYPLVAPPATEKAKGDAETSDNTAWEEARQELFGRRDDDRLRGMSPAMAQRYGLFSVKERSVQFSAAKVEALKKALVEAARNAANIRGLGDNDQVVIVAQGPSAPLLKNVEVNQRHAAERVVVTARGGGPQTTLVLRLKKADAEAFAAGKLSADEFTKKAETTAY